MIRHISTVTGTAILVIALFVSITLISFFIPKNTPVLSVISSHDQVAQVANVTNGLIAYYAFDDASGNTAKDSVGSNNGTLSGGPSWTTGKVGGALSFDGINDKVLISDSIGTNTTTVCSWVYPSNPNNGGAIVSNARFNLAVYVNNSRIYLSSTQSSGIFSGSNSVRANEWQHICAVRNSDGTGLVYNNGAEIASGNTGTPVSGYGLAIGDYEGGDRPWSGIIDDVRIYNRKLSPAEITQIYNLASGVTQPPVNTPVNTPPVNVSDTTAPSIPSGLALSSVTSSQVNITWNASSDAVGIVGYRINRCTGTSCTPTLLTTTSGTSYSDNSVSANTTYRYSVSAYDAVPNVSNSSSVLNVTTSAASAQSPSTPSSISTSCRESDFRAAVSSAKSGDTINVSAGTCSWDSVSAIAIPDNKKLNIIGAGIGSTVITRTLPFAALDLGKSGSRISGFTFSLPSNHDSIAIEVDGNGWRIDHNRFESVTNLYPTAIIVRAKTTETPKGLIDHSEFVDTMTAVATGIGKNDAEWFSPLNLGGDQATFIEDNVFRFTGFGEATDGNYGGRLVFRYNTVINTTIGIHSVQGDGRAMRNWEFYNNTFITNALPEDNFVFQLRGGTGVIFNNRFVGKWRQPIVFDNVRDEDRFTSFVVGKCSGGSFADGNSPIENGGSGQHTGSNGSLILSDSSQNWTENSFNRVGADVSKSVNHYVWNLTDGSKGLITLNTNNTITAVLSGGSRNNWNRGDRYKISDGYPCRDQVGQSSDEVLATTNNPYPPQTVDPVYTWNNKYESGADAGIILGSTHIKFNRDIYKDVCRPGYTPYTYPHPLTGATPITQNLNCPGSVSNPLASVKFINGDKVVVASVDINIRNSPGTSCTQCTIAGRHTTGDTGTIITNAQNGIYANGLYWWYVDFDSGADGWISESLILKNANVVNPNPVPNVPPTLSTISHNIVDVDPDAAGIQIYPDTTITLSAVANDTDPLTWVWVQKVNNEERSEAYGTGSINNMSYTYTTLGTYIWYIRVTDNIDAREHQLTLQVIPRPRMLRLTTSSVNGTILCDGASCPSVVKEGTDIVFTGLPETNYTFTGWSNPSSCTGSGSCTLTINDNMVVIGNFVETASPDNVGPQIADLKIKKLSNRGIEISWTTNELSTSQVDYGPTITRGTLTPVGSEFTSRHSVVVNELTRGQEYHFMVRSSDGAGNRTFGEDIKFTVPTKPTPVLLIGAEAGSVILNWSTPVDHDYTQVIIYRGNKALSAPTGTPLTTVSGKISTYTDESAEPSTTYVYTIFTKDADGVISQPRSITFTTNPPPTVSDVTKHIEPDQIVEAKLSYWKRLWMTLIGIFVN